MVSTFASGIVAPTAIAFIPERSAWGLLAVGVSVLFILRTSKLRWVSCGKVAGTAYGHPEATLKPPPGHLVAYR